MPQPQNTSRILYATERERGNIFSSSFSPAPYRPHALIAPVIERAQENYQLPGGSTDVPPQETAAIVAIIHYFIQSDPAIGITKLEQYIVMLDNICYQRMGQRLFNYRLLTGPYGYYIRNFRDFLNFLEQKNYIVKRKVFFDDGKFRYHFTSLQNIPQETFPSLLLEWLQYIVQTWRGVGADQTKEDIKQQISPAALNAFTAVPLMN